MDVLTVILIILGVVGVWCVAEVAITVRRARQGVEDVVKAAGELAEGAKEAIGQAKPLIANMNDAVTEARPVIAHVDEVVKQAAPAATDVAPLLQKTSVAVENLSGDLERIDAILTDVSRLTGTATNATAAVGAATTGILEKVRGRIGRRGASAGIAAPASETLPDAEDAQQAEVEAAPAGKVVTADAGYFTYPSTEDSRA